MHYSIMIVEDEPPSLRHIKRSIRDTMVNFNIVGEASNGLEALHQVKLLDHPPHVILTDIQMPVMDGLTMLEKISNMYPDVYKIVLSGHQDFNYASRSLDLQVEKYLLKPLQIDPLRTLLQSIYSHLENKRYLDTKAKLQQLLRGSHNFQPIITTSTAIKYTICTLHIEYLLSPSVNMMVNKKDDWDIDIIYDLLLPFINCDESAWVFEHHIQHEYIIVWSHVQPLEERLEMAISSVQSHDPYSQYAHTFNILSMITDISKLPMYTQQLFSYMHQHLIPDVSQILYADERKTKDSNDYRGLYIISQVKQYITDHYYEPLEINKLATQYGISTTYLSTLFKKTVGISPMEYVILTRINHAKHLIEQEPELLIKDISEMIGYPDNHYFSRVFKMATGQSPSEYRLSMREVGEGRT